MKSVKALLKPLTSSGLVSGALKSKMVLYAVTAIAMFNMFGYLANYEYRSVLFFAVTGVLVSCYSKNMIVVLAVATLATNLFLAGYSQRRFYEGFQDADADEDEEADEEDMEEDMEEPVEEPLEEDEEDDIGGGAAGFRQRKGKKGKKGKKDRFAQRDVPRSIPARVNGKKEDRIGKRVDYARTVEQAYDNLEGILGGDGMKNLTKDTQRLIKQQQTLMGTLQQMKPLIGMAKKTLGSVSPDAMAKQLTGAQDMLASLSK
jgi:hypothetical protein